MPPERSTRAGAEEADPGACHLHQDMMEEEDMVDPGHLTDTEMITTETITGTLLHEVILHHHDEEEEEDTEEDEVEAEMTTEVDLLEMTSEVLHHEDHPVVLLLVIMTTDTMTMVEPAILLPGERTRRTSSLTTWTTSAPRMTPWPPGHCLLATWSSTSLTRR